MRAVVAFFILVFITLGGVVPLSAEDFITHYNTLPMPQELWSYLRAGIHYLETSSKDLAPSFAHPGKKAFGQLGLSPAAVKDVKRLFPQFQEINDDVVFKERKVYEEFCCAYADILLRHYLKLPYQQMPKKEVFLILQRAWFLGPTQYRECPVLLLSREQATTRYLSYF